MSGDRDYLELKLTDEQSDRVRALTRGGEKLLAGWITSTPWPNHSKVVVLVPVPFPVAKKVCNLVIHGRVSSPSK